MARAADDASARVVVTTGAGGRAFCAGADLSGMAEGASPFDLHEGRGQLAGLFRDLWACGKPTIARVEGFALAGGFGLALAHDFVVAGRGAVFGTPEIDVGLWPMMITVPLLRSVPPKVALDLMLTGRRVDAEEGARMGFVSRLVDDETLDDAVDRLAGQLAAKSAAVMRIGRESFYRVLDMAADDALAYLHPMLSAATLTEDSAEGIAAFREKRAPRWSDR